MDYARFGLLLEEHKQSGFIRDGDIDFGSFCKMAGSHLSAYAARIVDEVGDEFRAAFAVPFDFKPV